MYLGLCLSDPHPDRASDGSMKRTVSAARFGGRYRLIDFMLSNMVNSGIYDIGMVLNSHYQSLIGHIGTGKEWDLARKSGGVTFFPPYLADERQSVNSEIDGPLYRAVERLGNNRAEYLVLADSSVVYNMDYRRAIAAHHESGADVTAIYARKPVDADARESTVVFDLTDAGFVRAISSAQNIDSAQNVSLGAYILPKQLFMQLVSNERNCGMLRFSRELLAGALKRLRVRAYLFEGYSAQVSSVETYFRHNMEMLDIESRRSLFNVEGRQILTSRRDSLPTKYGKSASVTNSLIADGCQIEGSVTNSVICRGVRIRPGAMVTNCIIHGGVVVEKGAVTGSLILDRKVIVSEGRRLLGSPNYPVYISPGRVV